MIYDRVSLLALYDVRFAQAAEFLAGCTPDMADGRYELPGGMYASVQSYETAAPHQRPPVESHRRYVDIQTCLVGRERIDVYDVADLTLKSHDPANDMLLYQPSAIAPLAVETAPGRAVVLYPHDAHQPGIHPTSGPGQVRKVVIKVPVADSDGKGVV